MPKMLKHHQMVLVTLLFTLCFSSSADIELHKDKSHLTRKRHQKSSFNSFGLFNSFETMNNTRISAQVGGTATLPCAVDESLQATVTWIRKSDYKLLTVGLATYSSDERFYVEHVRHSGIWNLRIKSVTMDDEGIYECNLSLHPPESIFIEVSVVEAIAEITGSPDIYIHEGSILKLECKIIQATENPSFVFWYHEDKMVNFNHQDGFSVLRLSEPALTKTHQTATNVLLLPNDDYDDDIVSKDESLVDEMEDANSMLLDNRNLIGSDSSSSIKEMSSSSNILMVNEVQFEHAGNYTCAPSNTRPTSVNVHVLKGEKPAAMKHSNQSETAEIKSSATTSNINTTFLISISICCFFIGLKICT